MTTRLNTPRNHLRRGLLTLVATATFAANHVALAQEQRPYPASNTFEGVSLQAEQRGRLSTLITAPRDPKLRRKITEQLCPGSIRRAEIVSDAVKPVLSVVEVSGATEILFSRPSDTTQTGPTQFSYLVEFFPNQVLVRHSTPRYISEAAGVIAPFPVDYTRGVWTEGKLGTDMLVLIPSTRDCGVQAVVLCPRVYQHPDKLVVSQFAPSAARWLYTAKADGLAAAALVTTEAPEKARVMASIQGNKNVTLPSQWFVVGNDNKNPAATIKHSIARQDPRALPPFMAMQLPHLISLQSRLDFGSQTSVLRTATRSTTIEISEFPVRNLDSVQVRNSLFTVEGGTCYLVAQWGETVL
jgi:hypothetical protein